MAYTYKKTQLIASQHDDYLARMKKLEIEKINENNLVNSLY